MQWSRWVAWGVAVAGCGPVLSVGPGDDDTTSSTGATTPDHDDDDDDDGEPTQSTSSTATSSAGPSTTDAPEPTVDTSNGESNGFIPDPDPDSGLDPSCDFWAQDCPAGEKCAPWADDGGPHWNAHRCVPVVDDPAAPGEPCEAEGGVTSGIDTCDAGSMCWAVDLDTGVGKCIAFCVGSEANPHCTSECSECAITSDGPLALCFPNCDPLGDDCDDGDACYPSNNGFSCYPDAGGDGGLVGEPCDFVNECDPGAFCAYPGAVPGCAGGNGCCTPYCDAGAEVDTCDAIVPGTVCTPWFEEGQAPRSCIGEHTIGVCIAPE